MPLELQAQGLALASLESCRMAHDWCKAIKNQAHMDSETKRSLAPTQWKPKANTKGPAYQGLSPCPLPLTLTLPLPLPMPLPITPSLVSACYLVKTTLPL